jgi:hypothetical protein
MKISGPEVEIWGRNPGYLGSANYRTQIPLDSVVRIGRGKIRPLKPNEQRRTPQQKEQSPPPPPPQPKPPVEPEQPAKRGPGRPRKNPEQEPESAHRKFASQLADQASAMIKPQFGPSTVDSDSLVSRPTPPDQTDLDPDLLRPLTVKLPSANDIPRKDQDT